MEKHDHSNCGGHNHAEPAYNFDISGIPIRKLDPIPLSYRLHNRERFMKSIRDQMGPRWKEKSIGIFRGHLQKFHNQEEDATVDWQPEWNFFYLFGLEGVFDCHAVMDFRNGEVTVAVHRKDDVEQIFDGDGITAESDPKQYGVDRFIYMDELQKFVEEIDPNEIFILYGKIRDEMSHFATFPWLDNHPKLNKKDLYCALMAQRAIKSDYEIKLMREVAKISSEAHKYVMKNCKPGMTEFKLRELFKLHCGLSGAPHESYSSICGCGANAAILHYIVNDKNLDDGKLVLNDMGARANGYIADITCTFPINGKFTEKQAQVYNIVLKANIEAGKFIKPGSTMDAAQKKSFEVICEGMIELGLIKADLKTAMEKDLYRCFMPHSLGHYMGLYVHDVGPCYFPERDRVKSEIPHCRSIMHPDTILKAGMFTSNEPGIYFIPILINKFKNDKENAQYFDFEKVEEYTCVGGIRIEDDVLVTEDGSEVYHEVPRTVEEIEAWMAGTKKEIVE